MDLRELTAQVELVSRHYSEKFGIVRSSDWHVLKLQEEVGELTQAHLRRQGQARAEGMGREELDARFAAEIADVLCHTLLIAEHHSIDVREAIERKWLTHRPEPDEPTALGTA